MLWASVTCPPRRIALIAKTSPVDRFEASQTSAKPPVPRQRSSEKSLSEGGRVMGASLDVLPGLCSAFFGRSEMLCCNRPTFSEMIARR